MSGPARSTTSTASAPAASAVAALAIDARVDKRFGAHVALRAATLQVRPGTIHAVVGENGAGKSTLLKIVFGLVRADGGRLALAGAEIGLGAHRPDRARARGLGMVQQHGVLVPGLSVVENAVLGREPTRGGGWRWLGRTLGLLQLAPEAARLRQAGDEIGLPVDPLASTEVLGLAQRQRAELVATVASGASVVILDEPTAVLAPSEVDGLLAALRRLRARGHTVVLVTHKLDEVVAVADDVTVLRAGATVATFAAADGPLEAGPIARAMVGGVAAAPADGEPPAAAPARAARPALVLRGLSVGSALHPLDLAVGAGEIVGVAGVDGNGQEELVAALAGLVRAAGRVELGGQVMSAASPGARLRAGLGHIPADRHASGLVLTASLLDNVVLARPELRRRWRDRATERAQVTALLVEADVRPADPDALAGALSGGNQQKLVVARELGRPGLRLVLAAHPTRGVDLVAVAAIHQRLRRAAAAGAGVLLVSADLDEVVALADRVVVMLRGRLVGHLPGAEARTAAGRARIGAWMTGADAAAASAGGAA
ncbi:MAG: ATP-binding cassette domain-containing protein [Kofleriaceae bacterium]|nr:ATP-binding cassette domain-containing protein [Kofleriaceae bacterium]MBP6839272.1 ATP-binding cassette domain-containing protein [Kofleriaceae bacterium]MBP9205376.1 ATP-binding cassette domain-containing protein [Kofleriaceae bacterium]